MAKFLSFFKFQVTSFLACLSDPSSVSQGRRSSLAKWDLSRWVKKITIHLKTLTSDMTGWDENLIWYNNYTYFDL